MTSPGRFLTFEGCEGCGKSTQITSTLAWLRSTSLTVHEVREPGGTPVGEVIRHLLKHGLAEAAQPGKQPHHAYQDSCNHPQ